MKKIGVVDTMFSRGDMARAAIDAMNSLAKEKKWRIKVVRATVPGVKDLPVAVLRILEQGCSAAIVFGMPGKMRIDKQCAHEASIGIQQAQLMTRKAVLEVFVHEDEAINDEELGKIMFNRASKHAVNLLWMLFSPQELAVRAGTGERQGKDNARSVEVKP